MTSFGFIFSILLSSISGFSQDLPYQDGKFDCISETKANQYIQDLRIDTKSFGGKELCNSAVETKKLFNDLQIIEQGTFDTFAGNKLIKGFVDAEKYYSWLKSQTRSVRRGNDIPFATAYNSGGHFTMQNGWAILSTLGRVGTVLHEARHTAGYIHYRCNEGPYKQTNVSGCDDRYSTGGSHAVEMEYYARVAVAGKNFHPAYKAMARLMAMGRANFVFNDSPIRSREALVTLTADHRTFVYEKDQGFERRAPFFEGVLKRTSFGASVFRGLQAFAIEMYENFSAMEDIEDIYSYFKMLPQDRGQGTEPVKDFEEFDMNGKRYVVILDQDSRLAKYDFQNGKFSDYVFSPQAGSYLEFKTTAPDGSSGLFIRGYDSDYFSVNPENLSQVTLEKTPWPADIHNFISWRQESWALDHSGRMLRWENSQWTHQPNFGQVSQALTVPLYDAFEVKP